MIEDEKSYSPPLRCIFGPEVPGPEHLHRFGPAAVVVTLPLWNGTEVGGGSTRLILFNKELV